MSFFFPKATKIEAIKPAQMLITSVNFQILCTELTQSRRH